MTGAVIALLIREPLLAVPLSFSSHFLCDSIPHAGLPPGGKLFSRSFNITLVCDFLFAIALMIVMGLLFPTQKWLIWTCMVAAASPDLMWAYYDLYVVKIKHRKPRLGRLARFHSWIQWSQTPKGWFVEISWFFVMGLVIASLR
ncbi:hypothetical protein BH10PAT3_BH10PAT3_1060 [soil metagenome]